MDCKFTIEEKSEVERSINIEIPRSLYDEKFNRVLGQTASNASLKGFRKGKAPKNVIAQMYGERIHTDVLGELVSSTYRKAIEENKLKVVGQPVVDLGEHSERKKSEDNFLVSASVSIMPEPKVKDYFGVKYEVEIEQADDAALDRQIKQMQENAAKIEADESQDVVQIDSIITIDFEGTIDGAEFNGSKGEAGLVDLSAEGLPKGFAGGLLGLKVGEERAVTCTMPENFQDKEVAGKSADYKVKLIQINKKILPELDDDFAKQASGAETFDEFKTKLKEDLDRNVVRNNKQAHTDRMFEAIIEKNSFEVPQALIDEQIRNILFEMRMLDPQKRESYQIDVSRFRQGLATPAEHRVRRAIVLEKVIETEGLETSDEDLNAWLDSQVEETGQSREQVEQMYGYPKNSDELKDMARREKMVEILLEKAQAKEVSKKED